MRLDAAARRAGVHPRTLRRGIDRGTITGQRETKTGPWMVRWQDVDRLYRRGPEPEPQPRADMVPAAVLAEMNARYAEQTKQLQGKVDELQGQVTDVRVRLAQAEALLSWRGRRRLTRLQQHT